MKEIINSILTIFTRIFENEIIKIILSLLIAILGTVLLIVAPTISIGILFVIYLAGIIYIEFFGG